MRRRLFDFKAVPKHERTLILAAILFWSILSYLLMSRYLLGAALVVGPSMEPTLVDGDRLTFNRVAYHLHGPERGDIVGIRMPGEEDYSVKRIVALPNELVQVHDGFVWVNGHCLMEPYLGPRAVTHGKALGTGTYEVAAGCYFVLGDNRQASADSREFGAIARDRIVGRVILFEPFQSWRVKREQPDKVVPAARDARAPASRG